MELYDVDYETYEEIPETDVWTVIGAFFEEKSLVSQQIESYDYFISTQMEQIISDQSKRGIEVAGYNQHLKETDFVTKPVKYRVELGTPSSCKPCHNEFGQDDDTQIDLYPREARLRNLTYSADVRVGVKLVTKKYDENKGKYDETLSDKGEQYLCSVPVMLQSKLCRLNGLSPNQLAELGECVYDQGGYFIINGKEKVLIAQERRTSNTVFVFKNKASNKVGWTAEVSSVTDDATRPASTVQLLMYNRKSKTGVADRYMIHVKIPGILDSIPICLVFRALGCTEDEAIYDHIFYTRDDTELLARFTPSIIESQGYNDEKVALDYIGSRSTSSNASKDNRIKFAQSVLHKDFLPHIGTEHNDIQDKRKVFYLGYMTHKLLELSVGRIEEDDRDHLANKRFDLAGAMVSKLFRTLLYRFTKDLKKYMQKAANPTKKTSGFEKNNGVMNEIDVLAGFRTNSITKGLQYSFATGNWGDRSNIGQFNKGISQGLERLTFASSLSHLRRLKLPIDTTSKEVKPRQLHNTQWGMLCPAETPEGHACGIVKNLALMSYITKGSSSKVIMEILGNNGLEDLGDQETSLIPSVTKVFVNGIWVGVHRDPKAVIDIASATLPSEVSYIYDITKQEIRFMSDAGRCTRPLFTVDKDTQKLKIRPSDVKRLLLPKDDYDRATFQDLVDEKLIQYLSAEEEEYSMIAMDSKMLNKCVSNGSITTFTHCEIHPSMILGVCASIIPFPDHNQSPRNTYQSSMGKQAMGVYISTFYKRFDSGGHILYYPQRPLVGTKAMEQLKFRELPAGINCCVAICTYSGYNQEDSLMVNQSSIDRGLFRSIYFRSYEDTESHEYQTNETFGKPMNNLCINLRVADYDKLDNDGLPFPGRHVTGNDIIIGKTMTVPDRPNEEKKHLSKDCSTVLRSHEFGVIDSVLVTTNGEGNRMVKVRTRSIRIPQIGDKLSSRHGQKGTIGMTYRQEDMPFNQDGITPDIIMNPHAIPSRMTIGQLIECLLGKVGALSGKEGDGTAFNDLTVDDISRDLHNAGYQKRGFERLYNGHTGRPLVARVFFGPVYYQRLKHLVDDKVHSRARGTTTLLTRQPMEGRSKEGGLRLGEMERDCLIAYGTSNLVRERLFFSSDHYSVYVCDHCGLICVNNAQQGVYCTICHTTTDISRIEIPYACKLLFQELLAMNIAPRIITGGAKMDGCDRYGRPYWDDLPTVRNTDIEI